MSHPARQLPSLTEVLERRAVRGLLRRLKRDVVVALLRDVLQECREDLLDNKKARRRFGPQTPTRAVLLKDVEARLMDASAELLEPRLERVINATGVLLHTNLGRARLSEAAAREVARVAREPVALEVDMSTGQRGSRNERIANWLRLLTGAEQALVVNNGAAALWLAVHSLGARRRAVMSRGEMVAIGGSFRMPDLMRSTGAKIVEVGTTNRTKVADYAKELREGDLVVKVHPSNYRIEGFTEEASLDGLAELCRQRGACLIFDAGSGSLYNFGRFGLTGEETVAASLRRGADVITFSGDKLLGGPQAGLVIGGSRWVDRMARHPMMRAMRCDKLVLSALEATLAAYAATDDPPALPIFESLKTKKTALRSRARALQDRIDPHVPTGWTVSTQRSEAAVGGGSFAEHPVSSYEVTVRPTRTVDAQRLQRALRAGKPSILAKVGDDALRIDVWTCSQDELEIIGERIVFAIGELAS